MKIKKSTFRVKIILMVTKGTCFMDREKNRYFYWMNVFSLAVVISMNALANILPFNNLTTGEISDKVNVLFTPAGYVFSIWGVIYLLLVVWVVRAFFVRQKKDQEAYSNIRYAFLVNAMLNSVWLLLFHYEFFSLTLVVMIALLINLIMIYRRIQSIEGISIWMRLPFSVYIGWISVATIVNVGIFFNRLGYEDGWLLSAELWTVSLLVVAVFLGAWFTVYNKDVIYPLVFIWAFIGIGVERFGEYPFLGVSAYIAAGVLIIFTMIQIIFMSLGQQKG